jgi:excisionase family DNA binding protein
MTYRIPRPLLSDPFLTVAEVAERLNLNSMTVYRAIHAGELEAVQLGSRYRIRETQFRAWITRSSAGPAQENGQYEDYPCLDVAEIAEALRLSKMTIYRAIRTGELEGFRFFPGAFRVRPSALQKWINGSD